MVMVFIAWPCQSFAQLTDCVISYAKALDMYNTGQFNVALETLTPCLESTNAQKKVSKSTRMELFRLAALCSYLTGKTEEADRYTRKVLFYQPDYKNNPRDDDLAEFTGSINSLIVLPKLSVGLSAGTSYPVVSLVNQYSAIDPEIQTHSISGKPGIHARFTIEYLFSKSLSLCAEPGYTYQQLDYRVVDSNSIEHNYDQELAFIEFPVLLRYRYHTNNAFVPTAYVGALGRIMLINMEESDELGNYWLTASSNTNGILSCFLISTNKLGIFAGGGVDFKLKNSAIGLDIRYVFNPTNPGHKSRFDSVTSYDDISSSENVYFTDHIGLVTLSKLQITLGYRYFLNYRVF